MQLLLDPATQEQCVLLLSVLIRLLVGLFPYSGAGHAPKFGDYEAQRHWMEVTTHLPPREWYQESQHNNATYWPLDYPPLSGYQSYLHGRWLRAVEPQAVALGASRGYESPASKRAMRMTVLASDLLVFFPAALACARALHGPRASARRAFALAATLLNPAAILIDHGHFQYNCISLGLSAAAAAAAAAAGAAGAAGGAAWRLLASAVLFCAALCHKQMALYYAPAFFGHMLGACLRRPGAARKVGGVLQLGATVILTFALVWLPWASDSPQAVLQVLHRIFPLRRGLYEDYVANFWCTSSVLLKWKQLLADDALPGVCAAATLLAALPSMAQQIGAPSPRGLLLAMANSGFAFFMLSFQVHEKSVLLPLLPVTLLAGHLPVAALWLVPVATASMFPLLERDGLTVPYAALMVLWCGAVWPWGQAIAGGLGGDDSSLAMLGAGGRASGGPSSPCIGGADANLGGHAGGGARLIRRAQAALACLSLVGLVALHCARAAVPPPPHLPWLHDRAFITAAFVLLAGIACCLQVMQWTQGRPAVASSAKKHQ